MSVDRPTAMAVAFYQATIANPRHRLCKSIGRAIERNAGLVRERESVRLSFRTAQQLKNEGVIQ